MTTQDLTRQTSSQAPRRRHRHPHRTHEGYQNQATGATSSGFEDSNNPGLVSSQPPMTNGINTEQSRAGPNGSHDHFVGAQGSFSWPDDEHADARGAVSMDSADHSFDDIERGYSGDHLDSSPAAYPGTYAYSHSYASYQQDHAGYNTMSHWGSQPLDPNTSSQNHQNSANGTVTEGWTNASSVVSHDGQSIYGNPTESHDQHALQYGNGYDTVDWDYTDVNTVDDGIDLNDGSPQGDHGVSPALEFWSGQPTRDDPSPYARFS